MNFPSQHTVKSMNASQNSENVNDTDLNEFLEPLEDSQNPEIINNYLTDLYQKENEIVCLETEDEHKKKVRFKQSIKEMNNTEKNKNKKKIIWFFSDFYTLIVQNSLEKIMRFSKNHKMFQCTENEKECFDQEKSSSKLLNFAANSYQMIEKKTKDHIDQLKEKLNSESFNSQYSDNLIQNQQPLQNKSETSQNEQNLKNNEIENINFETTKQVNTYLSDLYNKSYTKISSIKSQPPPKKSIPNSHIQKNSIKTNPNPSDAVSKKSIPKKSEDISQQSIPKKSQDISQQMNSPQNNIIKEIKKIQEAKTQPLIKPTIQKTPKSKENHKIDHTPEKSRENIKKILPNNRAKSEKKSQPRPPLESPIPPKKIKPILTHQITKIHEEKTKIAEKIKELDCKLSSIALNPKQTEKNLPPLIKPKENEIFIRKMQSIKQDIESKKAKEREEKQEALVKDLENLNKEKDKIMEIFRLEKEKNFWRKMHELEERKMERIQKLKENPKKIPHMVKTPELRRKKEENVGLPSINSNKKQNSFLNNTEKIRSVTPGTTPTRNEKNKTNIISNKPNYLNEIRKKNLEMGLKLKKDCENWEKYLKDDGLNKNEKFDEVINRAQIMENKAKMKEKVALNNNSGDLDLEMENEINNLYAESIKAKIALLENLKY